MDEIRAQVQELLGTTDYTQASLCRKIACSCGYTVTPSEMSRAVNGQMDTPKSRRVLVDSLSILSKRRERIENIACKARQTASVA